jgi:NADPH-dependent 7-cyano-7-deazaguanine reductase QueF
MIKVISTQSLESITAISFEVPFQVICPIPEQSYGGTIRISYVPAEQTIPNEDGSRASKQYTLVEWNSVAEWIEGLRKDEFMAEKLAQKVLDILRNLIHPRHMSIEVIIDSSFHLPTKVVAEYHE